MTSVWLPLLLAVQAAPSPQPPVLNLSVWPRSFVRYGEPVEVTVHTDRDGFLTVLRVDTHGRMHVLYPLEPTDEPFVQAGERVRVYDRVGPQAFAAFERDGEGTVLAALSENRYDFSAFMSGSRWSYSVMGVHYAGADHVQGLLDFVKQVAGTDRFEHAVVHYWVSGRRRFGWNSGYWNAACFDFGRFGPGSGYGYGWGWGGGGGSYRGYDPLYSVGYTSLHSFWYDDLLFSPYDCYGRRAFGYYGGGTIVIWPGYPGRPVDRSGFKQKKGTVVKPIEPRRRDPGAGGSGATEVALGRARDLRSLKPARPADEGITERSWAGRDRTVVRPHHDPQNPAPRQREFTKRDGDGHDARPRPMRPGRDRSFDRPAVDRPAPQRPPPAVDRPAPQRPAVERPAAKPAEKPKEKP